MTVSPKNILNPVNTIKWITSGELLESDPISETKQNTTLMDKDIEKENKWIANYVKKTIVKAAESVATNVAKKSATTEIQDKKQTAETDQKIANLQWVWQEFAQQKLQQKAQAAETISKMITPSAQKIFKQTWTSADWDTAYFTNWNWIITQPTIQSIDWNSTLGQAYDTVLDVLQTEWRIMDIDEFRQYFPEYKNISDDDINRFIWWVAYDWLVSKQKTDITDIANTMWNMSLAEWYTSKMDSQLDLFDDVAFVKYWIPDSARKDQKQAYYIHSMEILKQYANRLDEVGANVNWASQWTILQSYRDQLPAVDEALKYVEAIKEKKIDKRYDKWIEWYETNKLNAEVEKEISTDRQTIANEVNKDMTETAREYIDSLLTNRKESISEYSQKTWQHNFRLLKQILYWNYYQDNNWNYYSLDWDLLAYTKDWKTYDSDWEEINMNNYRVWLIKSWTEWILWLQEEITETAADVNKLSTAIDMWADKNLQRQYAAEITFDIVNWAFEWLMSFIPTAIVFQWVTQIPWWIGRTTDKLFQWASYVLWWITAWLWNITGFTGWWTDQWKEELKEAWANIWFMLIWKWRRGIKKTKRYQALEKSIKAWVDSLIERMWWESVITLSEAIKNWNIQIKNPTWTKGLPWQKALPWEKNKSVVEEWDLKWKDIVDITPTKEKIQNKVSLWKSAIQEAYNAMVETYKKEMWIKDTPQSQVELYSEQITANWWDATPVQEFTEKVNKASEKATWTDTPSQIEQLKQTVTTMKDNFISTIKQSKEEKTKTKQAKKLDTQLKKVKMTGSAIDTLKDNPYIWRLTDIINTLIIRDYWKDTTKKWKAETDVKQYTTEEKVSKTDIQDMILTPRYKSVQLLMDQLQWWRKNIHDAIYKTLPNEKTANIFSFWREWLTGKWKLVEFIERWDIEIYVTEKWEIKARYSWWDTTIDTMVESAIKVLNKVLDYYNEATKNWELNLSEKNLLDIKDRINKIWYDENTWQKRIWEEPIIAQELNTLFTKYLDDTGVAPNLRAWEKAMLKYHEIFELFDKVINENWEIKKQARNQMIKLDDKKIAELDAILPWTKEYIDLAKNWYEIVDKTVKQLTKMTYKHPIAANTTRYWIMVGAMKMVSALPLGRAFWIPVWTALWKMAKSKFKQIPEHEINKLFFDALKTTPEKQSEIKSIQNQISRSKQRIDKMFDEMINKNKWWDSTPSTQKDNWPKTPKWDTPISEMISPKEKEQTTPTTPEEEIIEINTATAELEAEIENLTNTVADELQRSFNEIKKTEWEEKAKDTVVKVVEKTVWSSSAIDDFLAEMEQTSTAMQWEKRPDFSKWSNASLDKLFNKDWSLKEWVPEEYKEEIYSEYQKRDFSKDINTSDIKTQNNIIDAINKDLELIAEWKIKDDIKDKYEESIRQSWNVDQYGASDIFDQIVDWKITKANVWQKNTIYEENEEAAQWIEQRTWKKTKATKSVSRTTSLEVWKTKPDTQGKLNSLKKQLEKRKQDITKTKSLKTQQKREQLIKDLEEEIARLEDLFSKWTPTEKIETKLSELEQEIKAIDEDFAENWPEIEEWQRIITESIADEEYNEEKPQVVSSIEWWIWTEEIKDEQIQAEDIKQAEMEWIKEQAKVKNKLDRLNALEYETQNPEERINRIAKEIEDSTPEIKNVKIEKDWDKYIVTRDILSQTWKKINSLKREFKTEDAFNEFAEEMITPKEDTYVSKTAWNYGWAFYDEE